MNLLATPAGRRLLFAALYLSEGAPIGFVWIALPTRLRAEGMPVETVTALSAFLVLPWALKFLWAPLVDTLRTARWTFRSWIVTAQGAMGLTLLPLLFLDPGEAGALVVLLLFAHAFSAATQDVAIDALAILCVPEPERGTLNGWMQAGMRIGLAAFGGGALWAAARVGDAAVLLGLVALVWGSLLLLLLATPPAEGARTELRRFGATLGAALARKETWAGLAFALVSGTAFEAVGAVAGPYLIDRGFAEDEAGQALAILPLAGLALGALAGGYLSDRIGRRRAAGLFLVLVAADVAGLAALDGAGEPTGAALLSVLGGLYFGIGLFTAASYALFMDLTDPRLGGTQFSAYMGATNACEAGSAFLVGRFAASSGYPGAFLRMALLSLCALPLLGLLRRR